MLQNVECDNDTDLRKIEYKLDNLLAMVEKQTKDLERRKRRKRRRR